MDDEGDYRLLRTYEQMFADGDDFALLLAIHECAERRLVVAL